MFPGCQFPEWNSRADLSPAKCTAAAHPRTRRLHLRTPYFFLARLALRASFFCTPAGWSMKRKRIPSTIALYFTAPVERPNSLAARRADIFSLARARIFFRSAGVQGELCLRDLAIFQNLVDYRWWKVYQ